MQLNLLYVVMCRLYIHWHLRHSLYWCSISDFIAGSFCYQALPVWCIIFADGSWPGFSAWFCTCLVETTQSRCIGMLWILHCKNMPVQSVFTVL